ncbi:MAG TPA: O-antigen ligase family protein [Ktedonobacterales bacterium]|jgi:O-antigen ligase
MALQVPPLARRSSASVRFVGLGLCLVFTLFFFWPHPPASLLLLVVAAALAYLRLEIAVALLPLTFPYFLFLKPLSPSGFPSFYIAELGMFICLGVMALRHVFMAEERRATGTWLRGLWRQAGAFIPPALLILVGAALGLLVSPVQHDSLRAYRQEIIEPLLYFLLMLRYLRTPTDLARAIGALILSSLVLACIGIGQGITQLTSFRDVLNPATLRVIAFTYSPNNLASLLDYAIPILLAMALSGMRRPRTAGAAVQPSIWRDPLRWICLALLLPLLLALYWTDSHGAELALLLVAFGFFAFEVRRWVVVLGIGAVGILGGVLFWSRLAGLLNSKTHGTFAERLYIWKAGLLMIRDHFLLGTGLHSFSTLFRPTAPNSYMLQALDGQTSGAPQASTPHPHDFLLDFWVSTGLLGEIGVLWVLGAFATVFVRTYRLCARLSQARLLQRLLLGIAGAMLASVIHGLVDNFYFLPDLALTFWFFMGILLVLRTLARQEYAALPDDAKQQREETVVAR